MAVVFFMGLLLLSSPQISWSGGLKGKIQQKLNAPSNIQYEPYYLESQFDASQPTSKPQTVGGEKKQTLSEENEGRVDRDYVANQAILSQSSLYPAELPLASPLSSYAIYQTDYKAELEENVVTVNGKVTFEVFNKRGWTQIPLVRSDVGLIDAKVNKGASFVTMQGNKYYLMIDRPGRYNLEIEFLIKASRERESGPGSFNVEVVPAPISQFEFIIPETGVDLFIEPAIKVEVDKEPARTVGWAVMPNTNAVTVRWTKALPKEQITPVKLEPKVYAETATYVSIGEGIMRSQTTVNYSVLQSEVSNFRIALPEDVSLIDVSGNDLRDWKTSKAEGVQYLDVYLNFGVKGNYALNLTYERNIGEGSAVAQIPSVTTTGVERENGYFGIAARTNVELAVNKAERVTPIDTKELPQTIWGRSAHPILLAFKYLNHPFDITIEVTKHEELPVLIAAIDSVNYVTLFTEEGKVLTKATFHVRNNVKQFLHLVLPKDATLWSTFVSGKPVKPAKDKNGNILIPLEKSQLQGESLTQFPVEVVYLDKAAKMTFVGGLKMNSPQTDIPISELYWSVYLPLEYSYFNFGGDVKLLKDEYQTMAGAGGFLGRSVQGRLRSAADDIGEQYSPGMTQQVAVLDKMESSQMTGVLPIKVSIPERGRLYRFSKLLVTEKESPWLSMYYTGAWVKVRGLVRLAIWIVVLFFVFKLIKNLQKKK